MIRLRMMQAWSVLLWASLVLGSYAAIRDHEYVPAAVGICVNLLVQYLLLKGIRQKKENLSGAADEKDLHQYDQTNRLVYRVALPLIAGMAISVGLIVAGIVTPGSWAFIVIALAIVAGYILTRSLRQVQREQRKY